MNNIKNKIGLIESSLRSKHDIRIFYGNINQELGDSSFTQLNKISTYHESHDIGNLWTQVPQEHAVTLLRDSFSYDVLYLVQENFDQNACADYAKSIAAIFEDGYEIYCNRFSCTGVWRDDIYAPFVAISDNETSLGIILKDANQYVFIRIVGDDIDD